jgi:hypothetical protein
VVRSSSWISANEPVVVAGYLIAGGLFYLGHTCRSAAGTVEPAQINPGLPVDPPSAARPVHDLAPAPAYHLISSAHRAAYLRWLAQGRTGDDVPLGLVQLFFSGLERRLLLDARTDPVARDEFAVISAELRRLRSRYGARHASFGAQVTSLLETLDLLAATPTPPPPQTAAPAPAIVPEAPRWPVPTALRIRLAQLANVGAPVPGDWARCWAWYHPALFPTMPQTRCPEEFDRLFALRYRRLSSGLVPAVADRPPVRTGYLPVNPAMDTVVVERPELPDVLEEPAATRRLAALVADVSGALTPYSRWLGRTPGGRNSVASTVLLPDDLLQDEPGPLRPLLAWADERLDGSATTVVDGGEFAPFWSCADPRRMSRDEAVSFVVVLARLGLGVEPDARFGGPPLASGPVVLFRLGRPGADGGTTVRVTGTYRAACHALSVVAATWPGVGDGVASSPAGAPIDPAVSRGELVNRGDLVNRAVTALAAEVPFSVDERIRLGAHLRWLLATGADPQPVRRRSGALTGEQREIGARVLLRLATETGPMGPQKVAALATGYRLLGLPEDRLYTQLHRAAAQQHEPQPPVRGAEADAGRAVVRVPEPVPEPVPVLARRARQADVGHPLPWTLDTVAGSGADRTTAAGSGADLGNLHRASSGGEGGAWLQLQPEMIARRAAETETVGVLLAEVFAADSVEAVGSVEAAGSSQTARIPEAPGGPKAHGGRGRGPADTPRAGSSSPAGPFAGLDVRHRGLLTELASRPAWTGAEFSALAAGHDLLPAGALEVINEMAIERAGQVVVEEDEVLVVDVAAARELLG